MITGSLFSRASDIWAMVSMSPSQTIIAMGTGMSMKDEKKPMHSMIYDVCDCSHIFSTRLANLKSKLNKS